MKLSTSLSIGLVTYLLLTSATQAALLNVTLHTSDPQSVVFSDVSGEYFTDWRIWENNGGSPAIADEKNYGASNIGNVTVSQGTRDGGGGHDFSYTDADAADGSGATNFSSAIKLASDHTVPVWASFSTSGLGTEGTLYVYSGGWASAQRLDVVLGTDTTSVNRPYSGSSYSDWWEIEYSGVTNPLASLDVTLTTTSDWHDLQLHAAALAVPEPSTCVLAAMGLFAIGLCAWRRRRPVAT